MGPYYWTGIEDVQAVSRVIQKEMANNTFRPRNRALASRAFGKEV